MDRERLTELLEDPTQVGQEDLADLRSMTVRFPWFSGAHLLLATAEHSTGDVLFTEHLRITAAHLPSRTTLFELVQEGSKVKVDPPSPALPSADVLVLEGTEVKIDPPSPQHVKASGTESETPTLVEEEGSAAKTEPVVTQPIASETPPIIKVDPLDAQIRQAAWSSNFDLARSKPPEPPAPRTVQVEDTHLERTVPTSLPSTKLPTDGPVSNKKDPFAPPRERKLKFTDWLEQIPPSTPILPKQDAKEKEASMERHDEQEKADAQALLDRFIHRSDATVTTPKVPFFNPHQTAKRSLLDDGMVSETLAKVHEQQGNFAKAIEVYDRLAMKHPEKSIYFAALSKALSGRSNK